MGNVSGSSSHADAESFQRLKSKYDRLRLLYQVSQTLSTTFNLSQVLQQVLVTTTAATGATRGNIMLFDEQGALQQHLFSTTFHELPPSQFTNRVMREGLAGWVLRHNQSVLIKDTQDDSRWIDYPSEFMDVRSVITAPLIRGRRVRGVLTLVHPQPNFFNDDDHELLNAIAQHAALAIENARLIADINDERRKFEGAVTAMAEGLILVDVQGAVRFVNPQALAFLGTSSPIPSSLRELSPLLQDIFERARSEGENIHTEINLPGPLDLSVNISYMPILSDQSDWWTILLHDITSMKEFDRLKTKFVANASHELRTPLANIKLYVRLTQQGKPRNRTKYLQVIAGEVSRLEDLVEDLLTLTRLDSGMIQCYLEITQIAPLIRTLMETYQPLAEARNLIFRLEEAEVLPLVELDPDQFTRILVNLLSNALKFTPAGGTVTVRIEPVEHHGQTGVAVRVIDTGIGISETDQQRLYDRFFRGTNTAVGGTGLGLTIVRELIGLMRGDVWVESTLGEGSTFTCWLPAITSEENSVSPFSISEITVSNL